jgi:hypothetical protein
VLPRANMSFYGLIELHLINCVAAALLCMPLSVRGQPADVTSAQDAKTAGEYLALRTVLKDKKAQCNLSDHDFTELDASANRLYFDLYNKDYKGPYSADTQRFVDIAAQTRDGAVKDPIAYDLYQRCQVALNEIQAFRRPPPVMTPGICTVVNPGCPRCPLGKDNWDRIFNNPPQLHGQYVNVWTGACRGAVDDAIVFKLYSCPAQGQIIQFYNRQICSPPDCTSSSLLKTNPDGSPLPTYPLSIDLGNGKSGTVNRPFTTDLANPAWFLDNTKSYEFFLAKGLTNAPTGLVDDEPSLPTFDQFTSKISLVDFVMCPAASGNNLEVKEVIAWSRQSVKNATPTYDAVRVLTGQERAQVLRQVCTAPNVARQASTLLGCPGR